MSFIDDIVSFGKTAIGFLSGDSIGSQLARTAALGLAVNTIQRMSAPESVATTASTTPGPDAGVRLQIKPSTANRIPVVYGQAYLGGVITDAQQSADLATMSIVMAICEKTGTLLSDGSDSVFTFQDIYWNDSRMVFEPDGITAAYTIDSTGQTDASIAGLVRIYCYAGNSNLPVVPFPYSNSALQAAYSVVPNWTAYHTMDNIIFAVVQMTYNSAAGITALPNITWHMKNSMDQPGDCLNDMMTNTMYGAGIDPSTIYAS
jgi:hypothetical protein